MPLPTRSTPQFFCDNHGDSTPDDQRFRNRFGDLSLVPVIKPNLPKNRTSSGTAKMI
jgi:hypothetical protein